jgi:hypothetical protein
MPAIEGLRLAPNWTTAAGALEGVLDFLGAGLPRHAIMGISGHAWHIGVSSRGATHVLPDGPNNLDWSWMVRGYRRLGVEWERFAAALDRADDWQAPREAAVEWIIARLDEGRPVIGWDFHLHEFSVVYGYDRERRGLLVQSVVTPEVGPLALWDDWPSSLGLIELFAPGKPAEADAVEVIAESLETAVAMLEGRPDAPSWGAAHDDQQEPSIIRGTEAFARWADVFEGDEEIDRAGNAYTIAVTQAAREDGARFLDDLARSIPDLAPALESAVRPLRETVKAMSPLVTLFPFPAGGHGNVANPGLRRAAAMPLRRCADYDREAAAAIADIVGQLRG